MAFSLSNALWNRDGTDKKDLQKFGISFFIWKFEIFVHFQFTKILYFQNNGYIGTMKKTIFLLHSIIPHCWDYSRYSLVELLLIVLKAFLHMH